MESLYIPRPIWLELGDGFSDSVSPAEFPKTTLRLRNQQWAEKVGLANLSDDQWIQHFARFVPLPDNLPKPQALRYHGHQFTHYNPELGDGRGFLFAQVEDPQSKKILDLGTKGSGQTPYSRQGDGRLTLKGAVREALATAWLEYNGVNTSKTFSVIETGESLERHDEPSPTRAAVLVRLSHSHIRLGTFQRLAYFQEKEKMEKLVSYCLEHYYQDSTIESFFEDICKQVAATTAQWMVHGFVHGVLNTDNINITGESFDYGPYRVLPHYDTKFTAAYFDQQGLYAYGRQPTMVYWNMERLKEALTLVNDNPSVYEKGLNTFQTHFHERVLKEFATKIGVEDTINDTLRNLFSLTLQFLEKTKAPFEAFHHHLYLWHQDLNSPLSTYNPDLYKDPMIEEIEILMGRLQREDKAKEKTKEDLNTLLIDEIESIWAAIDKEDNWQPFHKKLENLIPIGN